MNNEIKKLVDQLHNNNRFIFEYSEAISCSIRSVVSHHLQGKYNIPEKYQITAYNVAKRLLDEQNRIINEIKVNL